MVDLFGHNILIFLIMNYMTYHLWGKGATCTRMVLSWKWWENRREPWSSQMEKFRSDTESKEEKALSLFLEGTYWLKGTGNEEKISDVLNVVGGKRTVTKVVVATGSGGYWWLRVQSLKRNTHLLNLIKRLELTDIRRYTVASRLN